MRLPEARSKADHVVTGVVTAVHASETADYRNFVVEIKVEQVEKGAGFKPGDTFRATCYQRKEGAADRGPDDAGHKLVPKVGQRVKAYVKADGEAIYPDWIDILKPAR